METNLVIKFHPYDAKGVEVSCALCGRPMIRQAGLLLFLEGTGQAVCRFCGQRYAPLLDAMMEYYDLHEAEVLNWVATVAELRGRDSLRHDSREQKSAGYLGYIDGGVVREGEGFERRLAEQAPGCEE